MTKTTRARYTLEFKQEAVRLVQGGQSQAAVAKTLELVEQTLFNWVKASRQGVVPQFEIFGRTLLVRAALLGYRLGHQRSDFFQRPHVVGNPGLHGWCHAQRLVDAAEVVVHEVQRYSVPMVVHPFAELDGQTREPPHRRTAASSETTSLEGGIACAI